jgi:hypothetical protein
MTATPLKGLTSSLLSMQFMGFHHEHTLKMQNFKNICTASGHSALLTLTCMNNDSNNVIEV